MQREVVGYEQRREWMEGDDTWVAKLSCGHEVVLDAPPTPAPVGPRYANCPECKPPRLPES